jgi:hypothetical protein
MEFTQDQVNDIVIEAITEARKAADNLYAIHGDRDLCGFAWTNIYKVKGSTKLGRMLKAAGLQFNGYEKAFQIWNPSKHPTQSVGIKEAGAEAVAQVFRKYGFVAYSGSRLD